MLFSWFGCYHIIHQYSGYGLPHYPHPHTASTDSSYSSRSKMSLMMEKQKHALVFVFFSSASNKNIKKKKKEEEISELCQSAGAAAVTPLWIIPRSGSGKWVNLGTAPEQLRVLSWQPMEKPSVSIRFRIFLKYIFKTPCYLVSVQKRQFYTATD